MSIGTDNMAGNRISLVEQYNNKDVISQIYGMKDELGGYTDSIETAVKTAETAGTKADKAYTQAQTAEAKADSVVETAEQAQADATQALADAKTAQTTANTSLNDALIKTTASAGNLYMNQNDGGQKSTAIPIASSTQAGLMNAQSYASLLDLEDRVDALEGKTTTAYVSFDSDTPTQSECTTKFNIATGRTPIAGDIVYDIEKGIGYQYDGTTWILAKQTASPWSNTTAGLVKGSASGAGTIFAETDGTGSVNGWDDLVSDVTNAKTDITNIIAKNTEQDTKIAQNTADIATNKTNIATNTSDIAELDSSKQMKLQTGSGTLTTSGWVQQTSGYYTQAITSSIVTAGNIVWVAPTGNVDEYGVKGVYCSAQYEGGLTFTAKKLPEVAFTIAIVTAE